MTMSSTFISFWLYRSCKKKPAFHLPLYTVIANTKYMKWQNKKLQLNEKTVTECSTRRDGAANS